MKNAKKTVQTDAAENLNDEDQFPPAVGVQVVLEPELKAATQ
jgi:hypothetical protein